MQESLTAGLEGVLASRIGQLPFSASHRFVGVGGCKLHGSRNARPVSRGANIAIWACAVYCAWGVRDSLLGGDTKRSLRLETMRNLSSRLHPSGGLVWEDDRRRSRARDLRDRHRRAGSGSTTS